MVESRGAWPAVPWHAALAPQTTTFFITFLWVNTGSAPIDMCRLVDLLLYWVFSKMTPSPKVI